MTFVQTSVFRIVTSASIEVHRPLQLLQWFLEFKYFICVIIVKPCQVIHLILDKTYFYLLNPQLKSMKARIEKPSFYLIPKT